MATSPVTRTASDALLAKWSALDAGYRPVGRHGNIYSILLEEMTTEALKSEGIRQNRQSPLVNAGYAARLACMTYAVESFLSFHQKTNSLDESTTPPLQVVLLGCGLDVLGLWALSHSPDTIKVFEVDVPEIAVAKKELLESMEWLQVTSTQQDDGDAISVQGVVSATESDIVNYSIASCDLKDPVSVEKALASVDKSIPTLVLSELVLAYLGQQGTDDLLSWCSLNLCAARGSVFAAYEVLGPSSNNSMDVRSEIDGYKYQYSKKFQDKLERRVAQEGKTGDDKEETFHPLGDSPGAVKKRLSSDQFERSQTGLAGTVAACVFDRDKQMGGGRSYKPCEPFDEHAALTLHLHSYVFLCAFAKETDIDLIRVMCPWTRVSLFDMQPKVVRVDDDSEICVRSIEAKDQQQTIQLFLETYKDLSKQVSSVSKMVNAALRTDLQCSVNETHSSIGSRYKTWGGVFLVAVESREVNDSSEPSTVIGCVGIRRCDASEGDVRGGIVNTFEIHRLAVDTSCRGRGVGKMLLRIVEEEFVRPELNGEAYRIIATTPSLLKQANPLYTSNGFRLMKQESIGEMAINTYVKTGNR